MNKKRIILSVNDKIKVLKDVEKGIKVSEIIKKFGIQKSTVTKIIQNKENIERFISETCINPKKVKRMRHAQYEAVDKVLYEWYLQERVLKKIITNDLLKMKAKKIYQNLKGPQVVTQKCFLASDGWLTNFKNRYGIRLLTISGEKLSCDCSGMPRFIEFFKKTMEENKKANINKAIDSFTFTIEWAESNHFTFNEILLLRRMRKKAVLLKFE